MPKKGYKQTKEHREKVSLALKKLWEDDEYREKGCERVRGKNNSMYGKKHKESSKKLISQKAKGRKHSEETKAEMSRTRKGKPNSLLHNKHISEGQKGKKLSDEHIRKMSESLKGHKDTEETRRKKSEGHKGKPHPISEEGLKNILRASHKRPTKPEKELMDMLQFLFPNEYEYVGNGKLIIEGKCPDFVNINGKKKIIELFGSHWHEEKEESERISYFNHFGYDTLIVWDWELENKRKLVNKLLNFQGLPSLLCSIQSKLD